MAPKIYAIAPAGPKTNELRGCWDPANHEIDSARPEFVCPFDLVERYGYLAGESDGEYASRVSFEFTALLQEKGAVASGTLPKVLKDVATSIAAKVDHAEERAGHAIAEPV